MFLISSDGIFFKKKIFFVHEAPKFEYGGGVGGVWVICASFSGQNHKLAQVNQVRMKKTHIATMDYCGPFLPARCYQIGRRNGD